MAVSMEDRSLFHYVASTRNNPQEYDRLRSTPGLREEGLSNADFLNSCIAQNLYIPVLDRLWVSDLGTRISWLRENAPKLPPIFFLELGCAELEQSFSPDAVKTVFFPWFKVAQLRLKQDVDCLEFNRHEITEAFSKIDDQFQSMIRVSAQRDKIGKEILELKALLDQATIPNEQRLLTSKIMKLDVPFKLFQERVQLLQKGELSQRGEEILAGLEAFDDRVTLPIFEEFLLNTFNRLALQRLQEMGKAQGVCAKTIKECFQGGLASRASKATEEKMQSVMRQQGQCATPEWALKEALHPRYPFPVHKVLVLDIDVTVGLRLKSNWQRVHQQFADAVERRFAEEKIIDSFSVD